MKPLKLAYSKWLPFDGYYALTLFGFIIRRERNRGKPIDVVTYNHESIHHAQAGDFHLWYFGYIFFYLLYFLEWIFKLIFTLFGYSAYRSLSFEHEAYEYECDFEYLNRRKPFAWIRYIFKLVKR